MSLRLTFRQTKSIYCSKVNFLSNVMPKCFCALTDSILCSFIVTEMHSLSDVICFVPTTNACVLPQLTPILLSMHHVLKTPALICSLGSTTSSFFTGSMGNSIISVHVYVSLQMEWHVVYKYKEQNRSQYGTLRHTAFDWLTTWHLQPIHDTLRSVWKVWFKPAKRCASRAIWSQFLQTYFMNNNIKSLFLRSKNIAPTMFPLSIWLSQSYIKLINAVWQEWCFRKPDWASSKILYLFK